jgi:hypothetical protein
MLVSNYPGAGGFSRAGVPFVAVFGTLLFRLFAMEIST